jgi:nicotinate-nucleotide pyrophosphorylase (carboxylating)
MFDYNETLEQARQRNITDALMEDIGKRDWTAQLVASKPVHAQLIVREKLYCAG